ncbi:quinone-dependent dihydroorotate dehydrogenase [Acanthopleuribacter pedis]|uniref:Dihydroorotate dehydrogenase (quinone) n=1 Tax=Acanthopleuribacter pedis TaxID=442870 RepID=A0A8J7U4Z4_9BACT|nr:quinone-dependent dihydroorotate dehydrogenase [Acanthopleuribacter pedis]MBO1321167.1 quinone-dependent dihydroorotate dehydrogenase [Acanthopleuribacter pedis]
MLYDTLIKPLLFQFDPEQAHHMAEKVITSPLCSPLVGLQVPAVRFPGDFFDADLAGIPLRNPVGLAAGFDKNALMFRHLDRLGFGFVEIGTVTAKEQAGNPKPRLFRLPKDRALINRMGFNNHGAEKVAARLAGPPGTLPLGGNIGKSKVTPLEEAVDDYLFSFRKLKPYVDYFVVNVSSPNTPNLRQLQERAPLQALLNALSAENQDPKLPLFLKIAPDLNDAQLEDIVAVVHETRVDGVIATNTTIDRDGLATGSVKVEKIGAGGLSGRPVRQRATDVLQFLRRLLPEDVALVGVGGIFDGMDAYQKVRAGAATIQIYTGLVYGGPGTVVQLLNELYGLMARDGFTRFSEAIGVDVT